MLNKIILMGRLTRDVELRHTQTGTAVATTTLAVDRDFGDKATDFIDIVAWKGTAEFAERYFSKGRMAVVEGRLQIREWTDREGNNRRKAEVVADRLYFGDSKREEGGSRPAIPKPVDFGLPGEDAFAELEEDGEELPF